MKVAIAPPPRPAASFSKIEAKQSQRWSFAAQNLPRFRGISSSLFPRSPDSPTPRRSSKSPRTDPKFEFSLDMEEIADRASANLRRFRRSTEGRLRRFISSGKEAYHDLRTSVRSEGGRRIVFSCNRSSLVFVADFLLWSLLAAVSFRTILWFSVWLRRNWGLGDWEVVRRDRSLGGREIVVGRRSTGSKTKWKSENSLRNPLSSPRMGKEMRMVKSALVQSVPKEENLPDWWPTPSSPVGLLANEKVRREANRLARAIMDNRMSGNDYREDDMIQLRQICRLSGVKVSFDTVNSRDSFFRASVDFILKACYRAPSPTSKVQVDGEDVRNFIAGLADNIGLGTIHAIRILRGAVAAKTRSHFLQSWALEARGQRLEAVDELAKICCIFRIFPLETQSAEMEMVAGGLEKVFKMEQRVHLLNLFGQACGSDNEIIAAAAAALGLVNLVETQRNGVIKASD